MTLEPLGTADRSTGPEVAFVDFDQSMALLEEAERQLPRLSAADLARERNVRDPDERRLWRASRIAAHIAIERVAGTRYRNVDFVIAPGGRPGLSEGPHFSISHCGTTALIAVSTAGPVGIDIQRQRSLDITPDRRRGIVEAGAALVGEEPSVRIDDEVVVRAWVRLEAAGKALGIGVGELLTDAGVVGGQRPHRLFERTPGLDVKDLDVADGSAAALASNVKLPQRIDVLTFPRDSEGLAKFLSPAHGR